MDKIIEIFKIIGEVVTNPWAAITVITLFVLTFFKPAVSSWLLELQEDRATRRKKREKIGFHAAAGALQMEEYIVRCTSIAKINKFYNLRGDDLIEALRPADIGQEHAIASLMDYELVSRIYSLSRETDNIVPVTMHLATSDDEPNFRKHTFRRIQLRFAQLGLQAFYILKDWRKIYSLPCARTDEKNLDFIRRRIDELEKETREYENNSG